MKGHLIISTSNELLCVAGAQIIYIQADGNYSNMLISGGYIRQVTLQLHHVQLIQNFIPKVCVLCGISTKESDEGSFTILLLAGYTQK